MSILPLQSHVNDVHTEGQNIFQDDAFESAVWWMRPLYSGLNMLYSFFDIFLVARISVRMYSPGKTTHAMDFLIWNIGHSNRHLQLYSAVKELFASLSVQTKPLWVYWDGSFISTCEHTIDSEDVLYIYIYIYIWLTTKLMHLIEL